MELNKIYKPCSNTAAMKDFLFRVQKKREWRKSNIQPNCILFTNTIIKGKKKNNNNTKTSNSWKMNKEIQPERTKISSLLYGLFLLRRDWILNPTWLELGLFLLVIISNSCFKTQYGLLLTHIPSYLFNMWWASPRRPQNRCFCNISDYPVIVFRQDSENIPNLMIPWLFILNTNLEIIFREHIIAS